MALSNRKVLTARIRDLKNRLIELAGNPEIQSMNFERQRAALFQFLDHNPIVVRKDMSTELKNKLKDLFVNMKDHELGASVAADLKSSSSVDRFLAEDEALKLLPPDE